jgi:hypothetical protein
LIRVQRVSHPPQIKLFHAEIILQDPQAAGFCNAEVLAEHFARKEWGSFNIEAMASARSFVRGRPELESSHSEVLPCAKRFRQFFTVGKASASSA